MKYFDLAGKTALVTGGATGLGYEISKGLLECGACVLIVSRDSTKLAKAAKELRTFCLPTGRVDWLAADVTKGEDRDLIFSKVEEDFSGNLDILVNSAGINIRSNLSATKEAETNLVLETNLIAPMFLTKGLSRFLQKSKSARVINLASIFATISYAGRSNYSVSKGGLLQLTKTLAAEFAELGITVNSISPGPFLTELNKKVLDDPENYKDFCRNIPMGRFGDPLEIVTAALFLASPYSSYVTGSNVLVDGGWTAT